MAARRQLLAGMAMLAARPVAAQGAFPERPLRWLVGYPPGGASDVFARLIATQMAPLLGQPVVMENRPGGGAVLASEVAAGGTRWPYAAACRQRHPGRESGALCAPAL